MIPAAFTMLLEAALRALVAALALGLGLRLLRVRNVLAQKAVWGVVLAAALAMPLLMRWQWLPAWAEVKLPAPAWLNTADAAEQPAQTLSRLPVNAAGRAVQVQAAQMETDRFSAPTISAVPFDTPPNVDTPSSVDTLPSVNTPLSFESGAAPARSSAGMPTATAPVAARAPLRLFTVGALVYLGVCAALLLRLLLGLLSPLRLWLKADTVAIGPESGLARGIPVRSSRRVRSPVNIGSGILLPADHPQWDAEKLRVVLAHESSHVRQRDFYLQLLAGFYSALIWFSPLGWWLKRKLCELGEAISDRAGLEAAASPSAYAQLLLEFAALPRPAHTGVAMAHSTNLSERIERLLNDTHFRQAFAGRRRALLALALVPVALAATALVRVQAAETGAGPAAAPQVAASLPDQAPGQAAATGQAHPDEAQVTGQDSGQAAAPQSNPAPNPARNPEPNPEQNPALGAVPAPPTPEVMQAPPAPPVPDQEIAPAAPAPPMPQAPATDAVPAAPPVPPAADRHGYHYYRYDSGEAYAIVGDPGTQVRYFGGWDDDHQAEIDKARSVAHGHFLWFRHDGKSYIVDDAAIVAQIEAMDKPMEDLSAQMKEMGKQMRDAGEQARETARQAREASRSITVPDLSKEMADLNAAMATLQAKTGTTVSREQLAEIERKLADVQRKLMNVQIKVDVHWNGDMSELGRVQGEFGEKMGRMGGEMGRMARENDEKVRSIIDDSLKDGKARPVD
jgi:beta-lactamase regulating signal transducer with metallopeptidase domain